MKIVELKRTICPSVSCKVKLFIPVSEDVKRKFLVLIIDIEKIIKNVK